MKLGGLRRSGNIEDRRGGGGMGGPIAIGGGGLGLVVAIIYALMGGNPADILGDPSQQPAQQVAPGQPRPDDAALDFSAAVIGSTEDVWSEIFRQGGGTYTPTTFVPYDRATQTGCGGGQAAMGPFYCPADQRVYVDLTFFRELSAKYGAPGDFAQAYVLAHEVGHHVQHITGLDRRAGARRASGASSGAVRLELQADCFAGVWANRANAKSQILEPGDIEEGMAAANAVGDDTLQKRSQGRVVPDAFTHGTSAQRMRWFRTGYQTGDPDSCDTFAASQL